MAFWALGALILVTVAYVALTILRSSAARETAAAERGAAAIRAAAEVAAETIKLHAETNAHAAANQALAQADDEARALDEERATRSLAAERKALELERQAAELAVRAQTLGEREERLREKDTVSRALVDEATSHDREYRQLLERLAGERADEIRDRLVAEWIEEVRAAAAERLRRIEASMNDPEQTRAAKHTIDVAVQRFQGHYLTERLLTNVPIPAGLLPKIAGPDDSNLRTIEQVANITLTPSETGDTIRIEGQDSFGREIARRALNRFGKNGASGAEALRQCQAIAADLDREVMDLGKRAFRELDIPRAHPDLVKLVGKLNYRTSYTQNQWKHAIEAAFLAGMIADELGLDVRLARRAALLHDIGKALTHEIDGSHAVIGANLARQRGESEVIANAIGAHHGDEPFQSTYALIVAASDSLSGARPGARRQQDDNYAERIASLERIAAARPGVDRVYAVHGGREVRVHVQENRVSDARAVELSTEIARQISEQLTFPGQIKVTVIREVRAESIAS